MTEPRRALKQSINETLWKIQELEATVSNSNGDQTLLQSRLDQLVQELQKLQAHRSTLYVKLPIELLAYIDDGGNPDSYTAEVFSRANRANQFSKGKVEALQKFRDSLRKQVESSYPQEAAAYANLTRQTQPQHQQGPDTAKQAGALLQLLNAMAGGREVGTAVTIACQTVVKAPCLPGVKRLGYSVVKGAALTDADWENVLVGFLSDSSPTYPSTEVQIAALEILPLIPPHKLRNILPEGRLASTLTRQLGTSVSEVRAAAIAATGRWLADVGCSEALATSADSPANGRKWVGIIADALLSPSQQVASAAFDAARGILSSTEQQRLEQGGYLRQLMATEVTRLMLKALPTLLQKGRTLLPEGQVNVAGAVVALVEFCGNQPVFPNVHAPADGAAAPGADLLQLEDAQKAPTPTQASNPSAWIIVEQIGHFLQSLLSSISAPLVFEAAQGLLKLCSLASNRKQHSAPGFVVASAWAPLAVAALIQLWDKDGSARNSSSLHTQLVAVVAANIKALQALGQLQLARELFPMVAAVPSAAERTMALGHIWGAVLEQDMATRHARQSGQPGPPATELRSSLSDPFLLDVISAAEVDASQGNQAAFREEVVCVLVETLLSHPQGVIRGLEPLEEDREAASLAHTMKQAARAQSAGAIADWLGTAKIALQGTKACLGWDRDPVGGTYACTAVTDSWLVLLQRCMHAAAALQAAARGRHEAGAVLDAARAAASGMGAFQELLDQLLMHWQALSSAVQPRALWVAAHHYELAPSMDSGWAHLLQALSTSLGVHDDDARTRRKQSLRAAAARGQMQPVTPEEAGGFASPIDEAEIRTEAAAVGLVAADRLASLLLHNAEVGPRPGLKEISAALVAILQPLAAPNSTAGPQSRERAARIVAYLTPLALAPAPSAEAGEAIAVQTEFGAKLLAAPDWPLNEGFPMAGPSGATLQAMRRGLRYWALRSQVQAAIAAASGPSIAEQEPPQELAEPVGILEVMALISDAGEMGRGTVLTAPNDPLQLTAWHIMDAQSSRVTLQFQAHNQMNIVIEGVTIKLGLGGPMVPEAKQPPAYKLAILPSKESVTWRFSLRITGFGRISIQPFVLLPVQVPFEQGENPALRCVTYELPLTALLVRPSPVPLPDMFFQAWPSLALGTEVTGVCRNRGAVGGLQALSALESSPFARVFLQPLPVQGGFHAAYAGEVLGGARIGIIIVAQLLPIGTPPPRIHSGGLVPTGHVVCRMSVRSTQADVMDTVLADPPRFLLELFGRTLVEGVNADGLSGPAAPFRIEQSLIPVERLYAAGVESSIEETADGEVVEEHVVRKDREALVHDAINKEWQRIRLQRMGLAAN